MSCHGIADITENPQRDPKLAEKCLRRACDMNNHTASCHNLAVLYKLGDTAKGFLPQSELSLKYQEKTKELAKTTGSIQGMKAK
jgi:TPR repeat protein